MIECIDGHGGGSLSGGHDAKSQAKASTEEDGGSRDGGVDGHGELVHDTVIGPG